MSTFSYRVRDGEGRVLQGSLEAASADLVKQRLRDLGYLPITIEETKQSALTTEVKIPWLSNRVKLKEVAVFSRQFATMINSGLSLLRTLTVLSEQTQNETLAQVARDVANDVERGDSLSAALAKHPKVFDRL